MWRNTGGGGEREKISKLFIQYLYIYINDPFYSFLSLFFWKLATRNFYVHEFYVFIYPPSLSLSFDFDFRVYLYSTSLKYPADATKNFDVVIFFVEKQSKQTHSNNSLICLFVFCFDDDRFFNFEQQQKLKIFEIDLIFRWAKLHKDSNIQQQETSELNNNNNKIPPKKNQTTLI